MDFFADPGDPAAACQGGDEGLCVPRPPGAAQGGSVRGAGCSPWGDLKEIHKLRLKSGIFSLAFGPEEFT